MTKYRLLKMLQDTMEDGEVFDMSAASDPEEFRGELREAWTHLHENAAHAWLGALHPELGGTPEIIGPELCRRYVALSSCWLESFVEAIIQTGRRKDLPEKRDREFLYVRLGVLMASWQAYLALRRGETDSGAFQSG